MLEWNAWEEELHQERASYISRGIDPLESLTEDWFTKIFEEKLEAKERIGRTIPRARTKLGLDSGSTS